MTASTIMMESSSTPPAPVLPSPIRKSVSASCLLPPKYSCSSSLNRFTEADASNGSGPRSPPRKILFSRSLSTGSSTIGKDNSTMMTATTTLGVATKRSLATAVTIVHREKLPTYSSERFYLLSEIEMLAQPTIFLSSLNGGNEHESATEETDEISTLDDDHIMEDHAATTITNAEAHENKETTPIESANANTESTSDNNKMGNAFPPYVVLYILWGGRHMTNDPKEFADTYIQYAIDRIQNYVTIADTSLRYAKSGSSENGSVNSAQQQRESEGAAESAKPPVNLYLLIERVRPSSIDDDDNDNEDDEDPMQQELELAESLARYVAASSVSSPRHQQQQQQQQGLSFDDNGSSTSGNSNGSGDSKSTNTWRRIIQGITIGVSNHARAAPALDAAVSAISYGAADRRRYCTNNNSKGAVTSSNIRHIDRSLIGIVTMDPSELLGVESDGSTDAAQGIYQSKIVAEWNGNGNLQSFAMRAHCEWKSAVSYIDDPASSSLFYYDENGNRIAQPNKKALTPAKRRVPRINNRVTSYQQQLQNQHLYGNNNSTKLRAASYTNTTGGYRNYYDRYDNPTTSSPSFLPDDVVDFTVYCLLLCYILYHFYNDVVAMILSIVFGI